MKPLAVDLYAGLGGWTDGLLAEGYDVIGFDIERHVYGEHHYPAQLVLQDVLTLHGSQFRDAALIVASPPCQEYSYMAMPWSKAKAIAAEYREGKRDVKKLTALFDACFRIQREACEAAGRHIPLVVENVRGAQPWVGRSRWNWGSFHLWGDVPALMPMTGKRGAMKNTGGSWFQPPEGRHCYAKNCPDGRATMRDEDGAMKNPGFRFDGSGRSFQSESVERHIKTVGHINKRNGHDHTRHLTNQAESDGVKQHKSGRAWFADPDSISGATSSKSSARKAASAAIAKIPFPLARYIAQVFKPVANG